MNADKPAKLEPLSEDEAIKETENGEVNVVKEDEETSEEDKVPLGQECGDEDGDAEKNKQCQGKGVCKAYCSKGNENLEYKKCQFWCVAENGEECEGDYQCISEYC